MSPEQLRQLAQLFDEVVDLPESERDACISRRCGQDETLESELRKLVARHALVEHAVTASPFDFAEKHLEFGEQPALEPGQRIGPWQVASEIGRGGMGRVFRASRVDGAFAQEAAIKVIRSDRLNPALLKRFSTERDVLASLDHPGISRLLDAAALPDGTPYVVMELVLGVDLIEHCNARALGFAERVALFRKVLDAVAHAHRALVVHRDIKSGNVLVTEDGQPKLLDFGIAKALADSTLEATGTADRFFTPSHAAPEQLRGGLVTIGCDVYALGVLLYGLLSGRAPYHLADLTAGEIERLILSVPPPAMASSVSPTDASAAAAHGFSTVSAWRRALGGDLEAIVQRALRKEPDARYHSAEAFDADLCAWLEHRPVSASGRTQFWYRARKFAERNRALVAMGLAASLLLVATGVGIALQNVQLKRERDRVAAERDRAEFAVSFLTEAFTAADPAGMGGGDITARAILASARVPWRWMG